MDLNDSQARAAITALTSKYLSPYLSIYSNVTPDTYLSFQMGVYNTLIKGAPSHPEVYKLSNLYAFKAVAVSILTAGHYSKTAFDTNNPLYNPGVFGDKYIEKYLSPTIIVDWLTPNLNTLERQKIFSKFTSGELDQKSFVAAIGLLWLKGKHLRLLRS
ncbi:hypothetical protein [Pseudomonas fluorescens]|uniref:Uncharacterized protein n=1 Tax=Pseudomonas fluorescens TaxID=294 RepID=A0A5E7FUV6_PSEFL|nr:hypothetical protein [Pseudomonas fluorescens]VVO43116.1 hypothetical protein PS723_06121 [Pseudomonas fluorescens]